MKRRQKGQWIALAVVLGIVTLCGVALGASPQTHLKWGILVDDGYLTLKDGSATPTVTQTNGSGYFESTLEVDGASRFDGSVDLRSTFKIGGVTVSSTATELNLLHGVTSLATLTGLTATADEINTVCDGATVSAAEINLLDDVSGLVQGDFTKLAAIDATAAEINPLNGVTGLTTAELQVVSDTTASAAELNLLDGVTGLVQSDFTKLAAIDATYAEINLLAGVSGLAQADFTKLAAIDATAAEINPLNGVTGLTTAELQVVSDTTASAAEINKLDNAGLDLSIVAAAAGQYVCEVTFQVLDASGQNSVTEPFILTVWLSDAADGTGMTSTTASGTVQAKSGGGYSDFGTLTEKKALVVQTDTDGTYVLEITDDASTAFYPCATIPGTGGTKAGSVLSGEDYGS